MKLFESLMSTFPALAEQQVTLENMQQGPYNRWAFANLRRMLPTGQVSRGSGPVMPLPENIIDLSHVEFENAQGKRCNVKDLICEDYTDGFVVLQNGNLVTEQYRQGIDPIEPHLLMSVTKSLAACVAGILVERGLISVNDKITDIIPEVAGSAYDDALLRHLLDMTIGMDYDEDYVNPQSDVALLDVAAGWRPSRPGAPDNLRDYIKTMRKAGPHGEAFHYVSTNTDLLGWIIERASGTDFATLLSREIWAPMGAQCDAYITLDRLGAPQTDGGLCTTTRDLARFGQLILQKGKVNENQIIPAQWITDFQENGDTEVWNRGNFAQSMPDHHYRSKWYTRLSDPHHPCKGIGIHGQFIVVDPVANVVIAHHASHPNADDSEYLGDLDAAFCAICHYLHDSA